MTLPDNKSKYKSIARGVILKSILPTVVLLWLIEIGIRLLLPHFSPSTYNQLLRFFRGSEGIEDRSMIYEPHPYVGYVQTGDEDGNTVNSDGFNFPEYTRVKPKNTLRIAALGGSTTAGPNAWPHQLEQQLSNEGLSVEVLNFGTPGWTSAESTVNYVLNAQDYDADLVIVHHAANDIGPLSHPNFHPDYRHYRKVLQMSAEDQAQTRLSQQLRYQVDSFLGGQSFTYIFLRYLFIGLDRPQFDLQYLTVHSVENTISGPMPRQSDESKAKTFLRNLDSITLLAKSHGAQLLFVTIPFVKSTTAQLMPGWDTRTDDELAKQNERVLSWAKQKEYAHLDLQPVIGDKPDLYEDHIHLTIEGEKLKAQEIRKAIRTYNLLAD